MASTYSDRLKLELMETGANANTWGNNTNTNLETLDAFTAGYLSKSVAGSANVTLTSNNADPTAEASNKVIEFSGALTGNIYVFIPAVENNYIFFNNTTGAYTLTVAPTGHAANGVAITQGAHTIMYNNANNEIKDLFSGSLGNLSLVSGGVFTGNASGASAINASNVSSGTLGSDRLPSIPDAKLSANVNLNNASTISTGTLSNDRLGTVPTTKGGTGLTSLGSAGQVLRVNSPGGGLEFGTIEGGGGYNLQVFTNPGTYTPTSGMKNVKVTVLGGGAGANGTTDETASGLRPSGPAGAGGAAFEELTAAQVGASQPVTVGAGGNGGNNGNSNFNPGNAGGTTSFGAFLSATGGNSGTNRNPYPGGTGPFPGTAGSGSGGNANFSGLSSVPPLGFGFGGNSGSGSGNPGLNFASGGGGANATPSGGNGGGDGKPGIVIIEEFL